MALSYRDVFNWYARLWPKVSPKPPYKHIVQMGDPVLRKKASPIEIPAIRTQSTIKTIKMMKYVMEKYSTSSLSAPQIGVSQRIFAIEVKKSHFDKNFISKHEIDTFPLTVFINPQISVIGITKIAQLEGCTSVKGFSAQVSRNNEIKIQAYDENAEKFSIVLKGWLARLAQHEMDHLNGAFFTDTMIRDTMFCTCWEEVNKYEGKITLPFAP